MSPDNFPRHHLPHLPIHPTTRLQSTPASPSRTPPIPAPHIVEASPSRGALRPLLRPPPLAHPGTGSSFPPSASSLVGYPSTPSSLPSRSRASLDVVLAVTKPRPWRSHPSPKVSPCVPSVHRSPHKQLSSSSNIFNLHPT